MNDVDTDFAAALATVRVRFDAVDDELVRLIAQRLRLAREAGALKAAAGKPVVDVAREAAAAARRAALVERDDERALVDAVFAVLVAGSRRAQGAGDDGDDDDGSVGDLDVDLGDDEG